MTSSTSAIPSRKFCANFELLQKGHTGRHGLLRHAYCAAGGWARPQARSKPRSMGALVKLRPRGASQSTERQAWSSGPCGRRLHRKRLRKASRNTAANVSRPQRVAIFPDEDYGVPPHEPTPWSPVMISRLDIYLEPLRHLARSTQPEAHRLVIAEKQVNEFLATRSAALRASLEELDDAVKREAGGWPPEQCVILAGC